MKGKKERRLERNTIKQNIEMLDGIYEYPVATTAS